MIKKNFVNMIVLMLLTLLKKNECILHKKVIILKKFNILIHVQKIIFVQTNSFVFDTNKKNVKFSNIHDK